MKEICNHFYEDGLKCESEAKGNGFCDKHNQEKKTKPTKRNILRNKLRYFLGGGGIVLLLGGYLGCFNDAIDFKNWIHDQNKGYWECDRNGNIGGILLKKNKVYNKENLFVLVGDFKIAFPLFKNCFPPGTYESCPVHFSINDDNRLIINAKFYTSNNKLAGQISENIFNLNNGCLYDWNRDDTAFEVIDDDGYVVFQIQYHQNSNLLEINGIFYDELNNKKLIFYKNKLHLQSWESLRDSVSNDLIIPRIFRYSGKDYFNKRI